MIIFAKRNIIISIRSFLPTERHNVKTDGIYHRHCILVFWSKKGPKRAEKLPKITKVQSLWWTHPSTKWYSVHLYTFVSPCELRSAHLHSAHGGKHIHCVHWSVYSSRDCPAPFPYYQLRPMIVRLLCRSISSLLVLLFMWEPNSPSACLPLDTSQMVRLAAMSKQFVMMEHILFPETVPVVLTECIIPFVHLFQTKSQCGNTLIESIYQNIRKSK